jgi:endonuclease-3 related protein
MMRLETQQPGGEPGEALHQYYRVLLERLGPQGWWPARTRLEVILGAILTQNTAWHNVASALRQLRRAGLLGLPRLQKASRLQIEECIHPAGYYRQKARTIQNFLHWLASACHGSLAEMFACSPAQLRQELLEIKGLGPETVDTILLYAGRHPYFVADAYTRRILARHGMVSPAADYSKVQHFLHRHLPDEQALFNEFHALLVEVGKQYCRRQAANCEPCPLREFLPHPPARYAVRGAAREGKPFPHPAAREKEMEARLT